MLERVALVTGRAAARARRRVVGGRAEAHDDVVVVAGRLLRFAAELRPGKTPP